MLNDMELLEDIINQVNQLSTEYRLRLIQRVTETLITVPSRESKPLQYGKYKGNRMSTIADFAIAEWHPTDEELDGTEIYP